MDLQSFVESVPNLTDLELAILLSLIAKQSCLLYADDDLIDDLASELALIVSEIFKLSYVVLDPQDQQSVDRFGEAILDEHRNLANEADFGDSEETDAIGGLHSRLQSVQIRAGSRSSRTDQPKLDTRRVVNVVIAKDFNMAHNDVQIQMLELLRRRRIFSRTTVHPAPHVFLFLPIVATSAKHVRLNAHLNDRIFMSHYHEPENGFPNLEDLDQASISEDQDSSNSYSNLPASRHPKSGSRHAISQELIDQLRQLGQSATMTVEIRRYLQDVVTFLRIERGVDGGVTPYATVLFIDLVKYLAPLHGVDFVTPSLVGLAAKKIYPHRITIAAPERERSMQYGSDVEIVKEYLHDLTPEDVIELALARIDCPL